MYKVKYVLERFGCSKHQCLFTKERKKNRIILKGEDCTKKSLESKNLGKNTFLETSRGYLV